MIQQGIQINSDKNRFELDIKGVTPYVEYKEQFGVFHLTHIEVPFSMRDQGVGNGLLHSVMEHLENADKKFKAVCPFIQDFVKQNPQWTKLQVLDPNSH